MLLEMSYPDPRIAFFLFFSTVIARTLQNLYQTIWDSVNPTIVAWET
jgi:hypothetical protein